MLMRRSNFPSLLDTTTTSPKRFSDWMDDIFDEAFSWNSGTFVPELNVYETDKHFEITLALPGMSKNDIDISMEDHTLTISGERKLEHEDNGRKFHRLESRFGKFRRSLPLPNIVDTEKVKASYENGVLTVTIPKLKEKAGKKIEIS